MLEALPFINAGLLLSSEKLKLLFFKDFSFGVFSESFDDKVSELKLLR